MMICRVVAVVVAGSVKARLMVCRVAAVVIMVRCLGCLVWVRYRLISEFEYSISLP